MISVGFIKIHGIYNCLWEDVKQNLINVVDMTLAGGGEGGRGRLIDLLSSMKLENKNIYTYIYIIYFSRL